MQDVSPLEQDIARRKAVAAKASIAASVLLTLVKLAAGWWSGSLAVLSEAGHAGADVAATVMTFLAVRESAKPADEEHHYGHGKFEALAALIETGGLFGLALLVAGEAAQRLGGGSVEVDASWPAFLALFLSIAIDFTRWRKLGAIAKETRSDALAADALHFSSDLVSSTLVVAGLAATRAGFASADAWAALGVALFIGIAGFRLGRRTIETLLDAAPRELSPRVEQIVTRVPGVIAIDNLRLRVAGHEIMGEIAVKAPRTFPFERVARLTKEIEAAIARELPHAKITVTANPAELDDESALERILLVAARRRLPVHRVIAQHMDGRLAIALDAELDAAMPYGRAHAIATEFERAVAEEFGETLEIDAHIEPLKEHPLRAREADAALKHEIVDALIRCAKEGNEAVRMREARVRQTAEGLVVAYRCFVDPSLSVEAVHTAIDAIDRRMRAEFPDILRIAGRAEATGR